MTIPAAETDLVRRYLDELPRTYQVSNKSNILSYRTVSSTFGFIDDTIVRFDFCWDENGK
jgi:uncharacterized protein (DUF1499 family)